MPFVTTITDLGAEKIAAAITTSTPIVFAELAVGDDATEHDAGATALNNEVERVAVERVFSEEPAVVVVEAIIPADSGGYTIREVGLFDDEGDLLIAAQYPEVYKPEEAEGSARTSVIRIKLHIERPEAFDLTVDMTTVLTPRDDFEALEAEFGAHAADTDNPHAVTLAQLLPGGAEGEALIKDSAADGDAVWARLGSTPLVKLDDPAGPAFYADAGVVKTAQRIVVVYADRHYYYAAESTVNTSWVRTGDYDIWFSPSTGLSAYTYLLYAESEWTVRIPSTSVRLGGCHIGDVGAGDVLPASVWDLTYRPACPNPRCMVLVGGVGEDLDGVPGAVGAMSRGGLFWSDIYLATYPDGFGRTSCHQGDSSFGGALMVNGSVGPYSSSDWSYWQAVEWFGLHGKRLPTYAEFSLLARGATEETTEGSLSNTAVFISGRRSTWGVEMACGAGEIWLADAHPLGPDTGTDIPVTFDRGDFTASGLECSIGGKNGSRALRLNGVNTAAIRGRAVCAHIG